jgi:hypothetical protein
MAGTASAPPRDFPAVAARLRSIIEENAEGLLFSGSSPNGDVKLEKQPGGHPWDYVAGIRVGKSYVSYYLMPVYALPELLADISPDLRRRMQGKACFNFTRIDESLFSELATLTATGIERYRHFQPPSRR